ncbi:hypothetical protein BU16DRAFT_554133 [Lophium mytilinum]|uniref:Uncharacterized protein n=1 Tax=Lophium mytilinum TaxID=390894 RepID=A0A6A6RB85_9PEZI|nr:hypothetical protein BU16DRAFT_554133 [Lophium mytilinum]
MTTKVAEHNDKKGMKNAERNDRPREPTTSVTNLPPCNLTEPHPHPHKAMPLPAQPRHI